jgi:hypothetical protein
MININNKLDRELLNKQSYNAGLIRRQIKFIKMDPYGSSFRMFLDYELKVSFIQQSLPFSPQFLIDNIIYIRIFNIIFLFKKNIKYLLPKGRHLFK